MLRSIFYEQQILSIECDFHLIFCFIAFLVLQNQRRQIFNITEAGARDRFQLSLINRLNKTKSNIFYF